MERGMYIDVDHISGNTRRTILSILMNQRGSYPVISSHGRSLDLGFTPTERDAYSELGTTEWDAAMIFGLGGIVGIRTGDWAIRTADENLPNDCQGSSLSYAHHATHFINTYRKYFPR